MLERVIHGKDIQTGEKRVACGSDHLTKGTRKSTYREGISTVQFSQVPVNDTYNTIPNQPNPLSKAVGRQTTRQRSEITDEEETVQQNEITLRIWLEFPDRTAVLRSKRTLKTRCKHRQVNRIMHHHYTILQKEIYALGNSSSFHLPRIESSLIFNIAARPPEPRLETTSTDAPSHFDLASRIPQTSTESRTTWCPILGTG